MKKFILIIFILFCLSSLLPIFDKTRTDLWTSNFPEQQEYKFPKDFLWGASSAAQHVESQQPSDWTAFELEVIKKGHTDTDPKPGYAKPGHINSLDKYSLEIRTNKTNYDEVFNEDFKLAEAMGHNGHRFSISWARLFPKEDMENPDPAGIQYYQEILDSLADKNIEPLVSLFHFSTPEWFWYEKNGQRGWERDDALEHFEKFVSAVLENYGTQINNWCTLNEPMVYVFNGYMEGIFPPLEQRDISALGPVVKSLLEAHTLAYQLIHAHGQDNNQDNLVGIAKHTRAFEPMRNWAPLDRLTAAGIDQAFIWDVLDAINTGVLKISNTDYEVTIPGLKGSQDYIGVNYYGRYYVESNIFDLANPQIHFNDPLDKTEMVNDLDWAIYPHGFYNILTDTHERYGLPIYILENGMADSEMDDIRRQKFIVTHLREIWNAINYGGVDIRGYMHWSFIDNFEWAEGFTARFGLVKVDYENNFERIPRKSADIYSTIIKNNSIPKNMWDQFSIK